MGHGSIWINEYRHAAGLAHGLAANSETFVKGFVWLLSASLIPQHEFLFGAVPVERGSSAARRFTRASGKDTRLDRATGIAFVGAEVGEVSSAERRFETHHPSQVPAVRTGDRCQGCGFNARCLMRHVDSLPRPAAPRKCNLKNNK